MGGRRVVTVSVASLAIAGLLGGCASLKPEDVDWIRSADGIIGTAAEKPVTNDEDGDMGDEAGAEVSESKENGADERDSNGTRSDDADADADGEDSTLDDAPTRFLSFRFDQTYAEYPDTEELPLNPDDARYVISHLPAVIAIGDGGTYAVELSVTYESGEIVATPELRDEAVWLSDAIRREVVRLVSDGVDGKGTLEDALMEVVGGKTARKAREDGNPIVTGIDVYNVFEVETSMSYDETGTSVFYMPCFDKE